MELAELKTELQKHLSDGLVVVVGSGLSCSEGLPSMTALGNHLSATISGLSTADQALWEKILSLLPAEGLEAALLKNAPSTTLEAAIVTETVTYIETFESIAIGEAIVGKRTLHFARLLKHLLKPKTGVEIVTTNYDRLIEIACEQAGLGVNTMFLGQYCAQVDEKGAKKSFCKDIVVTNRKPRLIYREHANVYKPHGSLDWHQREDQPIRYAGALPLPRLIITPGLNKFRTGYNRPFDIHREKANAAIQTASRFLILGYGFNDDHLETHLAPRIGSGVPTVILTKTLSPNALKVCGGKANVLALHEHQQAGTFGTRAMSGSNESYFPNLNLWDLSQFITEVLE